MRPLLRRLAAPLLSLVLAACQTAAPASTAPAPAGAAAPVAAAAPRARGPFVAAANPLAVEAGMAVLRRGGSAADAAVAIQAVLGLVEPQSSGLGGGAFLMHYNAETGAVTAYDGRETAPSAATPELFYEDGRPLPFVDAVLSGRSTGAPGAVAMLALAQKDHGRLAWRDLFGDAERLARDGFVVSPRLAGMINGRAPQARTRWAAAYFTKADGGRYQAGEVLRNPDYARTVRMLADQGPGALYGGPLGQAVAEAVAEGPRPGALTAADIAAYRPLRRDPLCRPYRAYVVCVPPPPSSGVAVLEFLAMAEHTPDLDKGADSPEAWVAFGRLQRLMYADRDRYIGDADFVGVPIAGLLDPDYVAARAALVPTVNGPVDPGRPTGAPPVAADATAEPGGTSHVVVVDAWGNAVSMTTTVESIFGSGRMAGGFFLNNQLTDFSFTPTQGGLPAANAVAAGKRPRSSMTPTLILDRQGNLVGAIGSPGGSSILAYVAKALVGVIDWGLPVQQAVALPNLVVRGETVGADAQLLSPEIKAALAQAGMAVQPNATETSGLHGGLWRDGRWDGGADPRREGVAVSEVR
ncbi:MAG: gamma-glutamyltransferase [Brevundimonas sp.]|uniref:Gamma-glutamyltransferase family protein n=1 Tax=Brevundimonas albigilva TaxID=1312364 RepID=A0ABY4SLH5_9CAUL|nr:MULTISPECIES: gamma-glutamyltransferase family protein [Brevundimonas]PZU53415.1 MAG: gamma-glutamyltransferase [Brevundimonas sp.]URI14910.1 gamma-glutamyltransferase family protein [Brevundimonas albigilva]